MLPNYTFNINDNKLWTFSGPGTLDGDILALQKEKASSSLKAVTALLGTCLYEPGKHWQLLGGQSWPSLCFSPPYILVT